ncbi:hypothetical protein ACQV5J_07805 [Leptospira interrogans]|uniref:Uncharacterized protein n=2 Tax=Leptospira interrogans TaxID=173 RepID=A0A0E2D3W7_LEPIR|nr:MULTISPECIES: hypothetical protein [Leptospira]EMP09506.1 hypothetical protein LEP1GSC124_1556 [Leptospira interrogans serovar Pyrogenes str. 200701872]EKR54568.1 hypothetical protein LEP1GSC105_2899 [Leptospira interrogans str. UI 12758]UML79123.1 hypothetical protein FH602_12310 [Leptospira kirschneri]UML80386.1 hypothetical protein FH602_19410 [Leptospira kirschneri]UMQ54080.1 hypothetical protein FH582_19555 [Leptospira interrogans]
MIPNWLKDTLTEINDLAASDNNASSNVDEIYNLSQIALDKIEDLVCQEAN